MKNRRKKRCISCLLFHSVKRQECPYCGYRTDSGFIQPYHDALPLCSVVDRLRIGRAVQTDRNRIAYIGIDTVKNKRILIEEFFPYGYVRRRHDGAVFVADASYADIVELEKLDFVRKPGRTISGNGTVYKYHHLIRKKVFQKKKNLSRGNIVLRSIVGIRANQEDSADFRMIHHGVCAVLCDGMGGINGGETASAECVRIMLEISDTVQHCDAGVLPAVLHRQAIRADQHIASLQDMEERRLQCGTTLLYIVIRGDDMYFVSVGDSHIYLIRNDSIQLLTEEHNYLADLMQKVENGEMDYEDAVRHPRREALTSYIGIGNLQKIQVSSVPLPLREGDSILLCSDGLYRALSDEDIAQIITESPTTEAAADVLIRTVEERNLPKQDNTTLILYKHAGKGRK